MKTTTNMHAVAKHGENCKLKAYPDPKTGGKPWTIFWGHTGPEVVPGMTGTQEQADATLVADIAIREAIANNAITVPVTQGQFDCIVDMIFNIGPGAKGADRDGIITLKTGVQSTFWRKLSARDYDGARAEIIKWCSPGTNVEHGLRRRRTMDIALWDGKTGEEAIALGMAV